MKLVINDIKTGKSYQTEIEKSVESKFYGLKIGETFNGELIDLQGYQFKITGGSDKSGFPMRPDVKGSNRKKILLSKGVGFKATRDGLRKKRSVRGNTLNADIAQINSKVEKFGSKKLEEVFKKEDKGEEK